jgi:hypothetical protein
MVTHSGALFAPWLALVARLAALFPARLLVLCARLLRRDCFRHARARILAHLRLRLYLQLHPNLRLRLHPCRLPFLAPLDARLRGGLDLSPRLRRRLAEIAALGAHRLCGTPFGKVFPGA